MKLHINYLHIYTAKINCLRHEIATLQKEAEVTADKHEIESMTKALEELNTVLKSIPTIEKGEAYK